MSILSILISTSSLAQKMGMDMYGSFRGDPDVWNKWATCKSFDPELLRSYTKVAWYKYNLSFLVMDQGSGLGVWVWNGMDYIPSRCVWIMDRGLTFWAPAIWQEWVTEWGEVVLTYPGSPASVPPPQLCHLRSAEYRYPMRWMRSRPGQLRNAVFCNVFIYNRINIFVIYNDIININQS